MQVFVDGSNRNERFVIVCDEHSERHALGEAIFVSTGDPAISGKPSNAHTGVSAAVVGVDVAEEVVVVETTLAIAALPGYGSMPLSIPRTVSDLSRKPDHHFDSFVLS